MTRIEVLIPKYVEHISEDLENGVLYISKRYSTAIHHCCCGCGKEVVTPFNQAKWKLTEDQGKISLYPSIGNWSFPCQSHYWIKKNKVVWSDTMTEDEISYVREEDQKAVEILFDSKDGWVTRLTKRLREFISRLYGHRSSRK